MPLEDDDAESLATVLDGAIGELSMFHATHSFYIQGVGRRTAVLPDGWADRLVPVVNDNTHGRTGLCLDPHDLCAAKLLANREKDHEFVAALLVAGLVEADLLHVRLALVTGHAAPVAIAQRWLDAWT